MNIDLNKLPLLTRGILEDYLVPLHPRIPNESLVLVILSFVSKMLCYNRVTIHNDILQLNHTFPNIYTMTFSRSGGGKDRVQGSMRNITWFFRNASNKDFASFRENQEKSIDHEIADKKMGKVDEREYRKANAPRRLKSNIDSASTPEGFLSQRKAFEVAGFGYSEWSDGEIYDTIKTQDRVTRMFIKVNKECFDHGRNQDKIIKGDREPCDIEKVPHIVSLHGAVDKEEKEDRFRSFFNLGYARRSFLSMPERPEKYEEISVAEKKKQSEHALKHMDDCEKFLKDIFDKTAQDPEVVYDAQKEYTLSEGAVRMYQDYETKCEREAFELEDLNTEGVAREMEGRPWKMIKLSCILAAQNHNNFEINEKDIDSAIHLTNVFGGHFAKFYNLKKIVIEDRIVDYIIQSGGVTKSVLRREKFMPAGQFESTELIKRLLDKGGLNEAFAEKGRLLRKVKSGYRNRTIEYRAVVIPDSYQEIMTWIKGRQDLECLTVAVLVESGFKKGDVEIVLDDPKVEKGDDGGYFIS